MRAGIFIMIAACILTACSGSKVPSQYIQPHEMGNMLFEISMAEEFVNSYVAKDSSKNKDIVIQQEYQKIFLLHNVTEDQFEKSYKFYKSHINLYKEMMDSLNARAQRARNDLYLMPDY